MVTARVWRSNSWTRPSPYATTCKDEVACAELHDDIADVHLARGDIADAVMHYERGLSIARRLDRSALTADILLGLARCSRQMGKLEEVRVHLQEARAMIAGIDNSRPRQARLWLELAQIDADEGKEEGAIEGLEKALGAFRDCNDTAGAKECHRLLLAAYTRRQEFPEAGLHLSQGLELEGNMRAMWAVMLNQMHPAIRDAAHGSFVEGRFASGVLEALKFCEQELRARAELDRGAKMHDVTQNRTEGRSDAVASRHGRKRTTCTPSQQCAAALLVRAETRSPTSRCRWTPAKHSPGSALPT